MAEFTEAPYSIAPFDVEPTQPDGGKVRVVCYFVATVLEGNSGYRTLFGLGGLYATREFAKSFLPEKRAEFPAAQVTTTVLEFDLDNEAQLNAYISLQQQIHLERAELAAFEAGIQ